MKRAGYLADVLIVDELMGNPRPIGEQRWRRHHGLRTAQEAPRRSLKSGCSRRRRKAIERRAYWTRKTVDVMVDISASAHRAAHALQEVADATRAIAAAAKARNV